MGTQTWPIVRYQHGGFHRLDDVVVREEPLTLYVNDREVVTLLTLGDHPVELALGFLRSEGFFQTREELEAYRAEPGAVRVRVRRDVDALLKLMDRRVVTTGCGKGTTFYSALDGLRTRPLPDGLRVAPGQILRRMQELQKRSGLYRETGGTHNASLSDGERTLCFRTDVGRHNAVDMLGGWAFLEGVDTAGTLLLTTGRVSSEILLKTAKMGCPVLVSRSAPTHLALELARDLNVTVVGYVRGERFNVYTAPHRIAGTDERPTKRDKADEAGAA
ncbi:formate dehydrogenase accessory sulfurtransferase FdhD [Deferrisoma palaeochoriense]